MSKLTICCVTKFEEVCVPFIREMSDWCFNNEAEFVLGIDASTKEKSIYLPYWSRFVYVNSNGSIESVLDSVIEKCTGDYILRLDDDETMSTELSDWLKAGEFSDEIYSFHRYNLWGDTNHHLPQLYPDTQIRLATKAKSFGRNVIHNISPYGFGKTLNKPILHHKFIIRSYEDRKKIANTYESICPGAGSGEYLKYSLPEDYYKQIIIQEIK